MPQSGCRSINLKYINDSDYQRRSVGCLILSHDHQILLQLRDPDAPTFPNQLATFGGGIENNESPMQALARELNEELGADIFSSEIITLGTVTEPETNHHDLIYLYFWHDVNATITGCYEGKAQYFKNINEPTSLPNVMNDVLWAIEECKKFGLL